MSPPSGGAAVSALARLVVYGGTCASVLALRRQGPAPFTIPLGPVVPVVAIVISIALLYGATELQFKVGAAFLLAGAVLYVLGKKAKSKS